jgi:hypothetical protein
MRGLDMLPSGHQAMVHRGAEAGPVAVQTSLDAVLHLFGHLHECAPKPPGQNGQSGTVFPAGPR